MTELVITRGLPGSGKSTWARGWVAADPSSRLRVNRDDIRFMLYGSYWGEGVDEDVVTRMEEAMVKDALSAGKSVVVDATHLRATFVRKWARIHPITLEDFVVPVATAILRDGYRDRKVGGEVIQTMATRFHIPADGTLPKIDLSDVQPDEFKPYVPGGTFAYSFDIDGTLAHMTDRGPYDTSRYHTDEADMPMMILMDDLRSNTKDETVFIGLSGRSEDHRRTTERWLEDWGFSLDFLFMRPSGDQRNDAIVKSELVDKYISNEYDVIMHFDDRNRVVNALRAKGMKVAQVEPGDF